MALRYYAVCCEHCQDIFFTVEPLAITWRIECSRCWRMTPFRKARRVYFGP